MRIPNCSSLISATVALMVASTAAAQVNYSENFDVSVGGWTGGGGTVWFSDATACGGVGGSIRDNIFFTATTNWSQTPLTGTSFGGTMALSFDMKVADWDAAGSNNVGTAGWGTLDVQYGATATGPWTTIATILDTDDVQDGTTCFTKAYSFTPPPGDLYIRLTTTYATGDYYLNIDNFSCVENLSPCAGPITPGDTLVNGTFCNVGDSVTLTLQNATVGNGVTYQWLESADDITYTPFGAGNPTQSVMPSGPTYYKCDVTCSTGPVTGTSNAVLVDYATPVPGNTVAFPIAICGIGDPIDLSLDGNLPASATYQWYENGSPVLGANGATFTSNPVSTTVYYCDVSCGPNLVSSTPVVVDFAGAPTFPQPFLTSELDDCWTEVVSTNDVDGQPKFDATVSANGDGLGGSVFFDFWSWLPYADTCQWISPTFAPVAANTYVTFDVAGAQYNTAVDQVTLEESSDGGLTWGPIAFMNNAPGGGVLNPQNLTGLGPEYIPLDSEWASLAYQLGVGANRVRFVATTDFGNNVYFDNVNIEASAAAHIPYGVECVPGYNITGDVLPTQGTTVNYTVNGMPDYLPPLQVQIGLFVLSFGEAPVPVPLIVIGGDPTCLISIASLDFTAAIAQGPGAPNSATFPITIPTGVPNGVELFAQSVNLVPAPLNYQSSGALKIVLGL